MSALVNALLVALIALLLAVTQLLGGPTEIQAIEDVQAEVNQLSGVQQ